MQEMRLNLDLSGASDQINGLADSMLKRFPGGVPDHLVQEFLGLGSDVVVGDLVTALGADGSLEATCPVRLGGRFENLAAAMRATEGDRLSHASDCTAIKGLNETQT